jgi:hypothetical protein
VTPRPHSRPRPKAVRLPERNAVTIIAGFNCYQGIVLCADTQETIEHSKRHVPKLRFEPSGALEKKMRKQGVDLAAAFCGAGNGPFIDKLVDGAWNAALATTSLDEACGDIERSIKNQYEEFGRIYQRGFCPEVQLIFGVKMNGVSRLFTAMGPIVNEKSEYDSDGVGQYMADFLASRMYNEYLTIHQCVILAAYILFQAKEHVDGCGGDSHIAVLREKGSSGQVDWRRVAAITKLLQSSDAQIGRLLFHASNLDIGQDEFKANVNAIIDMLDDLREGKREELKRDAAIWGAWERRFSEGEPAKKDSLGLPIVDDQDSGPKRPGEK